jgi:uncharacterized protein
VLALPAYQAPWWLPGGNAQSIWPALFATKPTPQDVAYQRERWDTPDGDFVDVDLLPGPDPRAPWLVMFHGLEGTSRSHYALGCAIEARRRGWSFAVPHFRGCSGELNRGPRAYHSGDFEEIGWMLARLRARAPGPLYVMGFSLGGNALMRWAEEAGSTAGQTARAVASILAPRDLGAAGRAIEQGFNRISYMRMFLRSMKPKALAKWLQHPGLFDRDRLRASRTLYEFDQVFTAPLHGFKGTEDYWSRAAAKPHLHLVRIPALVLNAHNDPFVPGASLPAATEVGSYVTLWQPAAGGHCGFPSAGFPGVLNSTPGVVMDWLAAHG